MTSSWFLIVLIVLYAGCGAASLYEGNYARMLYMIGAGILTVALIYMK